MCSLSADLDSVSMHILFPEILKDLVHGSTIVELLFELDALTGHLDVAEHTEKRRCELLDVRVTPEQLFAHEPKMSCDEGKPQSREQRMLRGLSCTHVDVVDR